jgi:short-subunit dehydrogenase
MDTSKKAIIIGASSGIGKELAKVLSKNGYEVGLAARRTELLKELQSEIPNESFVKQMDVTDIDGSIAGFNELVEEMGDVDLVIISSGTYFDNYDLIWEKEKQTIDVNILGFAALASTAFMYFVQRGAGHIVGISSVKGFRGGGKSTAYNASKAFVSNFLEGLRKKAYCQCKRLVVTTIMAGVVITEMYKNGRKNSFLVATREKAAGQIYSAIVRRSELAYVTKRWWLVSMIYRNMPKWLHKRF